MTYSEMPIGRAASTKLDISGNQKAPNDFRRDENAVEQGEAEVRRAQHPLESHFAPTTGRGPLGRGISKQLARTLNIPTQE